MCVCHPLHRRLHSLANRRQCNLRRKPIVYHVINIRRTILFQVVYTLFQVLTGNLVIQPPGYIETLGGRYLQDPVNLGNLAWGVGHLSGARQKWVLDRAEVNNLAKQNAGVHSPRAQPTVCLTILSAHAKRRLVPLTQSWQHLARRVCLRSKDLHRTL